MALLTADAEFITAYAVGALVAAMPVTMLTQGMRRRPLLLTAIFGFAVVNLATALSDRYGISLAARFFAGVFGGIAWTLLAGYAVRMSPSHLSERAIAISGAGATIALVLGVPLGALLGRAIGWQGAFGLILAVASIMVFAVASVLLGLWGDLSQVVYPSVAVWGLAVGGFATITQTALSRFAGESVDVAQSMYTTGWNTAVASGGVVGGILLDRSDVASFAWTVIGFLVVSLLGTVFAMKIALTSRT